MERGVHLGIGAGACGLAVALLTIGEKPLPPWPLGFVWVLIWAGVVYGGGALRPSNLELSRKLVRRLWNGAYVFFALAIGWAAFSFWQHQSPHADVGLEMNETINYDVTGIQIVIDINNPNAEPAVFVTSVMSEMVPRSLLADLQKLAAWESEMTAVLDKVIENRPMLESIRSHSLPIREEWSGGDRDDFTRSHLTNGGEE